MNSVVNKYVEAHLDQVFSDAAQNRKKEMSGKRYKFVLHGGIMFNELVDKGECTIEDVVYDKEVDCNRITFTKWPEGISRTVNQFALSLTYIEEIEPNSRC